MARKQMIESSLTAGGGILRLIPNWIPRAFMTPGRRMRLAEADLYHFGSRGAIDERWFSSTVQADNGPGTPEDEGLSYVLSPDGERFLFRDAIREAGHDIIGTDMMQRWGDWPVFCKFFDNHGAIPHHLHQRNQHLTDGKQHKPEAYYFPEQYNPHAASFPYTFFGLEPGTSKEDIRRCLGRWQQGDNGILDYSKAYRLKLATGWLVPPGVLHAPGSLCTYEVQWASDVYAMYQSLVDGRQLAWESLVKDVPQDKQHDLDFILELIDWQANLNPNFRQQHFLEPRIVAQDARHTDKWIIYGKINGEDLFSARELTLAAGESLIVRDAGACGVLVVQGRGSLGQHEVETPSFIRFGEVTRDEFFVAHQAASEGYRISNTGNEPLVILRYFGPGAQKLDDA